MILPSTTKHSNQPDFGVFEFGPSWDTIELRNSSHPFIENAQVAPELSWTPWTSCDSPTTYNEIVNASEASESLGSAKREAMERQEQVPCPSCAKQFPTLPSLRYVRFSSLCLSYLLYVPNAKVLQFAESTKRHITSSTRAIMRTAEKLSIRRRIAVAMGRYIVMNETSCAMLRVASIVPSGKMR